MFFSFQQAATSRSYKNLEDGKLSTKLVTIYILKNIKAIQIVLFCVSLGDTGKNNPSPALVLFGATVTNNPQSLIIWMALTCNF